ncbi:MAG: twin-arginine translocase subunit TatC, partial [Planctomycetota bacterium]|nr:twin-arginine translocase subunit TatC [Planctomycetota bacterium]
MARKSDQHIMSFGDHLEDLRRRLFFALLGPVPIAVVCFFFGDELLQLLIDPLEAALREAGQPSRLLATSPLEPFAAYLKVSVLVAVLVSAPWILYQLWLFVSPGLHRHERRFAYFLFPMSTVLTAVGIVFLYKVLLPVSLSFLINFGAGLATQDTRPLPLPEGVTLPAMPVLDADPADPEPGAHWFNRRLHEFRIAIPSRSADETIVVGIPAS